MQTTRALPTLACLLIAGPLLANQPASQPESYHEPTPNQPPQADFTFVCDQLQCSFTDRSSDPNGRVISWDWDFGDGAGSTEQDPAHAYAAGGEYTVMLTVADSQNASDSIAQVVMVEEPTESFAINAAVGDAWFAPATDGQGFFIVVWEQSRLVFLSWFTYETERPPDDVAAQLGEPGHRWLTAQGPYSGDTATLDLYLTRGGVFDAADPPPMPAAAMGSVTIEWASCSAAMLAYDIPLLGLSGTVALERIVPDRVAACVAAQP